MHLLLFFFFCDSLPYQKETSWMSKSSANPSFHTIYWLNVVNIFCEDYMMRFHSGRPSKRQFSKETKRHPITCFSTASLMSADLISLLFDILPFLVVPVILSLYRNANQRSPTFCQKILVVICGLCYEVANDWLVFHLALPRIHGIFSATKMLMSCLYWSGKIRTWQVKGTSFIS